MAAAEFEIDYEAAFQLYRARFAERFGERAEGAFVKFGKHMIKRLPRSEFDRRLDTYVRLHKACKKMLDSGSTISDALVLDFDESAAWIAVEAPNVHAMFRGEMGDPRRAAPELLRTDPDANAITSEMDQASLKVTRRS
ncbi:MAG: hypothetical protein U0234_05035 [Sandaracinus sp.]